MFARLGPSQPAPGADVIVRAVAALALAGLAVIHVVDLPGTLGIAALSVEALIIMLVVLAAWLGRSPAASVPAESRPAVRRAPEYSQHR